MRGLIDAIWPLYVESGLSRAYRRALARHGATPQGVFWNSSKARPHGSPRFWVRSRTMPGGGTRLLPISAAAMARCSTICGTVRNIAAGSMRGIDITRAMIAESQTQASAGCSNVAVGKLPPSRVDYVVFSGTFNLCLIDDPDRWQRYILDALAGCWPRCRHGMALNLLCRRETAIEASIFYAVEADMTAALRRFGRVKAAPARGLKHDVTFLVTR